MPQIQRNLLVFGRLLRRLGIDVHVGRLLDVTEALQHVDLSSRDEVYYTCRALLVYRHDQLAIFDRAFEAFWMGKIHVRGVRLEGAGSEEQDPAYDRQDAPDDDGGSKEQDLATNNDNVGPVLLDRPEGASERTRPTTASSS